MQPLQSHLPPQHRRQSLCSGPLDPPAEAGRTRLPRVTMRLPSSTVDNIFSLRQLQEKYREQQMPLYIICIDFTKVFDLQSCLPTKTAEHDRILPHQFEGHGMVQFHSSLSGPFDIRSGVKQHCVLALTVFGIFFALLLKCAFATTTEDIYLHTRSDGRLFNLDRLSAKTKVPDAVVRDMLVADNAPVATHTQHELRSLMDRVYEACKDFGLTINLKKMNVLA